MEVRPMRLEDKETLRAVFTGKYTAGFCVSFAIAGKRLMKYPKLIGLFKKGELWHAANKSSKMYLDVTGMYTTDEFTRRWGCDEIRVCTEEELLSLDGKNDDKTIKEAMEVFELLYPEFMVENALTERMQRIRGFVEALETLSREHGIFLRGDELAGIVMYNAYGDEKGYSVAFGPTGGALLFRELKG